MFCDDSCNLYVGLLFEPLHDLVWQKWFSTPSWLTSHCLITELGNFVNLIFTTDLKPWTIDWRSNQSLLEMNCLGVASSFQSEKNCMKPSRFLILESSYTHNCFPTCTKKFNYRTCVVYHLYCCIKCTAILSIICQMLLVGLQRGKTKNKQLNTLSQKMAGAITYFDEVH